MWGRKAKAVQADQAGAPAHLKDAVRQARIETAERTGVVVDMRDAELARLELLNEALDPMFSEALQSPSVREGPPSAEADDLTLREREVLQLLAEALPNKVIAQRLATGRSVVVFPEGHRSRGAKLDLFKKGAAVLAAEQGAPILPITISGTDVLYPPGSLMIHRGDVLVEIQKPIETAGRTAADREAIIKQVRASVRLPCPR